MSEGYLPGRERLWLLQETLEESVWCHSHGHEMGKIQTQGLPENEASPESRGKVSTGHNSEPDPTCPEAGAILGCPALPSWKRLDSLSQRK